MPNLTCTVTKCGHNENKLCALNSIDVSGGGEKDNTCCNNFTHDQSMKNHATNATSSTHIYCQAKDCKYNDENVCMADSIEVSPCCSDNSCEDTRCSTFVKQ